MSEPTPEAAEARLSALRKDWTRYLNDNEIYDPRAGGSVFLCGSEVADIVRDGLWLLAEVARLTAERDEARLALALMVGCIDTNAADRGPAITQGSMMAEVCRVIQRTTQYDRAKAALAGPPPAATGLTPGAGG